jgi:hypothetical protein
MEVPFRAFVLSDHDVKARDKPTSAEWRHWKRLLGVPYKYLVRELMLVAPACPLAERYGKYAAKLTEGDGLDLKVIEINLFLRLCGQAAVNEFHLSMANFGHPPSGSLAYVVGDSRDSRQPTLPNSAAIFFLHPYQSSGNGISS